MRPETVRKFRLLLEARREEIASLAAANDADRATVVLDQQSVGRLSRMDALQRQAMAEETRRRRSIELRRIEQAFRLIEEDEYGYCQSCGEEIGAGRLEVDPTATRCIDCAR